MAHNSKIQNKAHEIKAVNDDEKILTFRIADLNIAVSCLYGYAFYGFEDYRSFFDCADISMSISQSDIDYYRLSHHDIISPDVFINDERVSITYDYGCLEPFIALEKFADAIVPFNEFVMHGSVVALDGKAYMFTAPSGTGKTTRTRIWLEQFPDSIIVNGDKPVIRVTETSVLAYGTPWCGKEGLNTNTMIPLHAIFLLERGESDAIEEISLGKAFPTLLQQTHRPVDPDAMRKTISLLQSLYGRVRFFKFRSTPTANAIHLAYTSART